MMNEKDNTEILEQNDVFYFGELLLCRIKERYAQVQEDYDWSYQLDSDINLLRKVISIAIDFKQKHTREK